MKKKVIVFGSCNLDLFFDISDMGFFVDTSLGAEDALHFDSHKQAPGGKGANQAVAAAKAGAKVHFFGAVGRGAHARFLIENFKKIGINASGIKETPEPTGLAVIFNKPNGSHKIVVSHGANRLAKSSQVPDRLLNKNTLLVFQTETDLKENAKLMKRGKKKGAKVIFNVAPAAALPPKDLLNIDYLILNKPEAEVIAKSERMGVENLPLFAKAMADKFDLMCIVTLGKLGVLAAFPDKDAVISLPSLPVKAIDTVGAGDAFVGAFAAALAENEDPSTALAHGVVAGSLACTRIGAQTALPTAKEIKKKLRSLGPKF